MWLTIVQTIVALGAKCIATPLRRLLIVVVLLLASAAVVASCDLIPSLPGQPDIVRRDMEADIAAVCVCGPQGVHTEHIEVRPLPPLQSTMTDQ